MYHGIYIFCLLLGLTNWNLCFSYVSLDETMYLEKEDDVMAKREEGLLLVEKKEQECTAMHWKLDQKLLVRY